MMPFLSAQEPPGHGIKPRARRHAQTLEKGKHAGLIDASAEHSIPGRPAQSGRADASRKERVIFPAIPAARFRQDGAVDRETLDAAGELLDAHIRLEERQLFPLIEELVPDDELRRLGLADRDATCAVRRPPVTS
jgi:hypothetical protein